MSSKSLPLPLDAVTGAQFAFSLRKLSSSDNGKILRVARSDNGSQVDINTDANGWISESQISSHLGSSDGQVVTWYERNGVTARNATQPTPSNRPLIAEAGVLIRDSNNLPTMKFNGGKFLNFDSGLTSTDREISLIAIHELYNAASANHYVVSIGSNSPVVPLHAMAVNSTNGYYTYDGALKYFTGASTIKDVQRMALWLFKNSSPTQATLYLDNAIRSLSSALTPYTLDNGIGRIGAYDVGGLNSWNGEISEIISYKRILDTTEIATIRNLLNITYEIF